MKFRPRFFALVTSFALFCAEPATAAKKEKPLTAAADLRYGVALYHYYQKEYMEALTELLIAKERGGIQGHGDNPEIMEGGFTLAYGMERHASQIFDRVLAQNVSPKAQSAAWFYIAKVRYLRGDFVGAQKAIGNMLRGDYEGLGDDALALRINIAIQRDDLTLAERILEREEPGGGWMPYINFNMGSAWARKNNFPAAVAYLTLLAEEKYKAPEHKALYDKAMTAAGYSLLLDKRYDDALQKFSGVRLNTYLSGRALLGYGWAASEKGDFKDALRAWNHLSKQTLVDENSQEALIAVPYAYEKLGMEGLALERFLEAEKSYLSEIARIQKVVDNLRGDNMLMALNITSSEGIDWLRYARENQLSPQLTYLISLFSREEFQGLVQELRDLLAIQKNTRDWREKLDFYSSMLETREKSRYEKSAYMAEQALRDKISHLERQRKELVGKIERIAASKDYMAVSSEDESDLFRRVERGKKYAEALRDEDPFIDETEEALRRYHGLLVWDSSEKFSDRIWLVVKKLNVLDKQINDIRKNYNKVNRILRDAPNITNYQGRISASRAKLDVQQRQIDAAVVRLQGELRRQVASVLLAQRERLTLYLSQSRLSVARLYDKANIEAIKEQEDSEAAESGGEPGGESGGEPGAGQDTDPNTKAQGGTNE